MPPDSNNPVSSPATTVASTTTSGSLNTTITTEASVNVSTVSPQSTQNDLSQMVTTQTSVNETTSVVSLNNVFSMPTRSDFYLNHDLKATAYECVSNVKFTANRNSFLL